jgi:hypothetical protein
MAGTLTISTLSDGTNSTSSTNCIQGSAKAWVNFNGVSGASARASYNISSLTRSSTGIYVINFTNALTDANYCINMSISVGTSASGGYTTMVNSSNTTIVTPTTTSCTVSINLVGVGPTDSSYVMVSIFR